MKTKTKIIFSSILIPLLCVLSTGLGLVIYFTSFAKVDVKATDGTVLFRTRASASQTGYTTYYYYLKNQSQFQDDIKKSLVPFTKLPIAVTQFKGTTEENPLLKKTDIVSTAYYFNISNDTTDVFYLDYYELNCFNLTSLTWSIKEGDFWTDYINLPIVECADEQTLKYKAPISIDFEQNWRYYNEYYLTQNKDYYQVNDLDKTVLIKSLRNNIISSALQRSEVFNYKLAILGTVITITKI